jgi:hypothetical protein
MVLGEDGTPETAWLASSVFGLSTKDLLSKIKQEIFRGEMKRPVMVKSSDECVAAVAKSDGGVGVVTAAAAKSLPGTVAVLKLTD